MNLNLAQGHRVIQPSGYTEPLSEYAALCTVPPCLYFALRPLEHSATILSVCLLDEIQLMEARCRNCIAAVRSACRGRKMIP